MNFGRWHDRNLSRMELIIVCIILMLLIGYSYRYASTVFSNVEQSMVERTVLNINTALNYQAAMLIITGQYEKLNLMQIANPMDLMQGKVDIYDFYHKKNDMKTVLHNISPTKPDNYAGLIASDNLHTMEQGKWYFQQDAYVLVYSLRNSDNFLSDLPGPARIQYRVKLDFRDNNDNNQYDGVIDEFTGIKLKPLEDYQWQP